MDIFSIDSASIFWSKSFVLLDKDVILNLMNRKVLIPNCWHNVPHTSTIFFSYLTETYMLCIPIFLLFPSRLTHIAQSLCLSPSFPSFIRCLTLSLVSLTILPLFPRGPISPDGPMVPAQRPK